MSATVNRNVEGRMKYCSFVLAAGMLFLATTASAQRLVIDVGGANFRPFPVAAPALATGTDDSADTRRIAHELTALLQGGITLARSLELVPVRTYLDPEREPWNKPVFANWVNVGASGLVRGSLGLKDGKAQLALKFYDVVAQREALSRSYSVPATAGSTAIYQFLDELILLLTGEQGIFSSRLAYVKRTRDGKAVFVADVDGRNERRLSDERGMALLPRWDRSGAALFFTSYLKGNPDLYRLSLADTKLEALSHQRGINTGAAASPDGKRIALTLSKDGNTEIYVMNADGSGIRRLTESLGQDMSPTWSPDGKRIAFVSSRSGAPHIYLMNADGSGQRRLTFQGNYNQEPNWSPRPDGQIAFTARDERLKFDIFLVHPDSGAITRLTQDEGNNESPSHSPDGYQLVFVSTRPPQSGRKLYVMDIDGSNQERVSRTPGDHETPSWGPRLGWK